MTIERKILKSLVDFNYTVMREQSITKDVEYYFCVIEKKEIYDNKELFLFYNGCSDDFPKNDLSKATVNFIKNNNKKYFFVLIDELKLADVLYEVKKKAIENNPNNILSLKYFNKLCDKKSHYSNNFEVYLETYKNIGLQISSIAADKMKKIINKGIAEIENKKPNIENKIKNLINYIK